MKVEKNTPKKTPRWLQTRKIASRIIVTGTLTLLTPARFGGDSKGDQLTDMPLLRDLKEGLPLLPGASIAGAMRAYLREWALGYEENERSNRSSVVQELFGDVLEQESRESYLIIEDAYAEKLESEFRPGVSIDPTTRTVKQDEKGRGQLYDMQLLQTGTQFPLHIELALPEKENEQKQLKQALAVALTGFERGEIGLGARKRRGFGECQVTSWRVETYDLNSPEGLIAWLKGERGAQQAEKSIASLLGVSLPHDKRKRFCLTARFQLETSLMIRSGGEKPDDPDMAHLTSRRRGKKDPVTILSGTSLAGAIRARALRIARTVYPGDADVLIDGLFGGDIEEQRKRGKVRASKAIFYERDVKGRNDLVQTRIRIDRFTGGTFPGALFEQQPIFGGQSSEVCIEIELRKPEDAHIGLLLHVLKDLWTGDLPLGGEASVGRGRLQGVEANLRLQEPGSSEIWWRIMPKSDHSVTIESSFETLEAGKQKLETFAKSVAGGAS